MIRSAIDQAIVDALQRKRWQSPAELATAVWRSMSYRSVPLTEVYIAIRKLREAGDIESRETIYSGCTIVMYRLPKKIGGRR